jgi:imidazole glycerol-phosphate synthase subunit HisH
MIVIVDYGVGNVASIVNMLRKIGESAVSSSDPASLASADAIILPGVGAFDHAMRKLRESKLLNALETRVLRDRVPTLGLCLGMQLLTTRSEEGLERGLGWVAARTVRFDVKKVESRFTVPFMGWSDVEPVRQHSLLDSEGSEMRFYFAHSFHVECEDPSLVIGTAHHGYAFPAAIAHDNILGVQFHPEKSHVFGMRVLRNFCAVDQPASVTKL